ncbi:MAG: hypothetical protein GXN98_03600 [Euryarchaeota archaeon]|nr:hypothetical protein [Euryarchaeota archaeon]
MIAEFILRFFPGLKHAVEVGVGRRREVLEALRRAGVEVTGVDIAPGRGLVVDDITEPEMSLYRGAELIYAIRPPPELYPHLMRLARRAGACLLIVPMSTDPVPENMRLVNYRGAAFYLWLPDRSDTHLPTSPLG